MKITNTHHMALATPNFELLKRFYTEALGFPLVGGFPGHNIVFIDAGSTTIELIERDGTPAQNRQGWTHLALTVENIDDAYSELAAKGIVFHVLPKDFPAPSPSVRIGFFKDPDGNEIELVQRLTAGYPQPTAARKL